MQSYHLGILKTKRIALIVALIVALIIALIVAEPGYYEDNKFGIRIESLVVVVDAKTEHNFKQKGFLTFEPITLVPLQAKLIVTSMLTKQEVHWVNQYHEQCIELVGAELKKAGRKEAYDWLIKETAPLMP
jgi:Xaa-Pro aminopeptidase